MQLKQIFTIFALTSASVSAAPQNQQFTETLNKISLKYPDISDAATHDAAIGYLDAVSKVGYASQVDPTHIGDAETLSRCLCKYS